MEQGSCSLTIIQFGLMNCHAVFYRVVVVLFRDYTHKFKEIYSHYKIACNLLMNHVMNIWLMLKKCWKMKMSLNIKQCTFFYSIGVQSRHIVCKDRLLVDHTKILVIINLLGLEIVSILWEMLGHIGYYLRFIQGYEDLTNEIYYFLHKGSSSSRLPT